MLNFIINFFAILVPAFAALKLFAVMEENKDEISFAQPGIEFLLFSLGAALVLTITDFAPWWFCYLAILYMTICAETDIKECAVYRICHYPVIICSLAMIYQNYGFKVAFPVAYVVLLLLAHVLKAYKSGDTWMFFSLGLFLMANELDDLGLLLFWLYSIVVFLLLNITKMRYAPLDGEEKKTIRLTEPQPIGPAIFIGLMLTLIF